LLVIIWGGFLFGLSFFSQGGRDRGEGGMMGTFLREGGIKRANKK